MEPQEQPKPARIPFFKALDNLMDNYGMVDYAFVAKAVDGQVRANWIAGTGEGVISDRERAGQLYFELGHLQHSLIKMTLPKG